MRSVGSTLILDFLRKGRWHLLQLLVTPFLPLLLYIILVRTAPIETRGLRFIFYMTMLMETLCCTAFLGVLQASVNSANLLGGFPRRLYTLPVSTARLVGWQMLPGIAVIMLVHLYAAVFIRLLTGVMPPIVEPILFLIMVYGGAMAVVWALPLFAVLRLAALAAVAFFPGLWFTETYAPRADLPAGVIWAPPALATLLWMPLATVAAYAVSVWGVARDRHGEAWSLPGVKIAWAGLLDRAPQRRRPFASPQAAQFWFELCQKGWIMPAAALLLIVVMPVVCLGGTGNRMDDVLEGLCGLPFFLTLPLSLVAGIFMGRNDLTAVSENGLDLFRATRPLSDAALSSATHKVGLFNIVSCMAICVAAALAMTAVMGLAGHGDLARQVWQHWTKEFGIKEIGLWSYPLYLALAMLGSWIVLSMATVLGQAGNGQLMARLTGGGMVLVISTIFAQFWLPAQVTLWIVHGTLIVLGSAFLFGGGGAMLVCWHHRLVGPVMTRAFLGAWLLLVGIGVWALVYAELNTPRPVNFFWIGVLTLAPATTLMGALAMGWNRHR